MPEEQKEKIRNPWRVFAFELGFFILALCLGIVAAWRLKSIFEFWSVVPLKISIGNFILWFSVVTLLIVWIAYFVKARKIKKIVFKALFVFSVFFGSFFFLS